MVAHRCKEWFLVDCYEIARSDVSGQDGPTYAARSDRDDCVLVRLRGPTYRVGPAMTRSFGVPIL